MRRPFLSLFKIRSIPAWALFLWAVAEQLERIEWVNDKRRQLWEAAVTPAGGLIALGCSILWLTALFFWPEIKRSFPRLPKSLAERIGDIEDSTIPGLASRCSDLNRRIDELISRLANQANETRGKIDEASFGLNDRLDEQKLWIRELEERAKAAEMALPMTAQKLGLLSDQHGEYLKNLDKRLTKLESDAMLRL
jgi:hypothetical protein